MTTERSYNLDRIITREVETTVSAPGTKEYTWGEHYDLAGGLRAGTWRRDASRMLTVATETTTGGDFPIDLVAPLDNVTVDVDGSSATVTVTEIEIVRDTLTFRPVAVTLTFGANLPTAGVVLALGIPTGASMPITTTTRVNVWAMRRDFTGRDFTTAIAGGIVSIEDRRYVVRSGKRPLDYGR